MHKFRIRTTTRATTRTTIHGRIGWSDFSDQSVPSHSQVSPKLLVVAFVPPKSTTRWRTGSYAIACCERPVGRVRGRRWSQPPSVSSHVSPRWSEERHPPNMTTRWRVRSYVIAVAALPASRRSCAQSTWAESDVAIRRAANESRVCPRRLVVERGLGASRRVITYARARFARRSLGRVSDTLRHAKWSSRTSACPSRWLGGRAGRTVPTGRSELSPGHALGLARSKAGGQRTVLRLWAPQYPR